MSNAERLIEVLGPAFPSGELTEVDPDLIARMVDSVAGIAADEIVGVMSGGEQVERTYQGVDGLRAGWMEWLEAFARVRFEVESVEEIGDNVLTLARQIGTTRHGAVEIEQPSAAVWKFRDGELVRLEFHLDRELARRSAEDGEGAAAR